MGNTTPSALPLLPLPYEIDERSIILPPGTLLQGADVASMLGGDPLLWHVWIVGRLQSADSIVPLVLKFEGDEADYVDIYLLVVYSRDGVILRTEVLGVFSNVGGRRVTSRARIDEDLRVWREIERSD